MRKTIFLFLTIVFAMNVGYSQVTTLWEKSAGAGSLPGWFSTSSTERGFGQGYVDGNYRIYIPSRNGGTNVYIYNALTGDSVGTLNTTGITGGLFPVNDADVSTDGVIFVCNMTTDASNVANPFKVYRYDSEAAAPQVVISLNTTPSTLRLGDKFTVTGSTADNSVTIWAASGNSSDVYMFTTTDNGLTFTPSVHIVSPFAATPSVGPVPNGDFYYNANGQNPRKFSSSSSLIGTIPGTVVATGSNAIRYITDLSGSEYIATFAYGAGNENARIVKVPGGVPDSTTTFVGATNSLGVNSNANGTGDVSVQKVSPFVYNIYVLSTNNGFGAYQLDLSPAPLLTIAQAREDLNNDAIPDRLGDTVMVNGIVISPNYQTTNHSYYVWDGTAGITEILFGTTNPVLNLGDEVYITGTIGQFRGLTQIQPFVEGDVIIASTGNPTPAPTILTIAQYLADPEAYEGSLVGFVSLNKVGGTWPNAGGSATLQLSDGVDTVDFRIDSDTDLDNNPEPTWPRDILGLASQFAATGQVYGGLQILGRYYATDILPPGTVPVELTSFTASVSGNAVQLNWTTATELNNQGFEIERKSVNTQWERIGFVAGFGTTTESKSYTFTDNTAAQGSYTYRLKQIDFDGTFSYSQEVEVNTAIPTEFTLAQNYPNPFNPTTKINYSVPFDSKVTISVYSITGELVAELVNNFVTAGSHSVNFDASNLSSGMYIYKMTAGSFTQSNKMLLLK